MKNYDIYNWIGNEATNEYGNIGSQNVQMPKASQPELFIIKTNNYKKVYDTTVSVYGMIHIVNIIKWVQIKLIQEI